MKYTNLRLLLFTFSTTTTFCLTFGALNEEIASPNPIEIRPNPLLANENIVGLDCEFVGGKANDGSPSRRQKNLLARVSIVNWLGHPIYDKFVRPEKDEIIVDFRTEFSGVRPENLQKSDDSVVEFDEAQKEVKKLIEGKIVVGHQLDSDFNVSLDFVERKC